ncbi:hypothetical protein LCGC14_2255690 [marine sediment metagenome]|uniref:Uncharacterized protein n=1 Tax=marine sediment metagenome TaxID=412755 RepID=A0A0F9D123_9ZZZZ
MHIVTDHVLPDEPCHGLAEGPMHMPFGAGFQRRWVQRIFVIRGDAIAKHMIDLGPAEDWEDRAMPLIMPSFGENTVAQLQESAEQTRNEGKYIRYRTDLLANSTLIEDSLAGLEQQYLAKSNRTTIGPHVFAQRGSYPGQFARRELKERVNGHSN